MKKLNIKKLSPLSITTIILCSMLLTITAILIVSQNITNTCKIKSVGIEVQPLEIEWSDLIEGEAENQTRTLTISNTKNVDVMVSFSDDLAGDSLFMEYPSSFILNAGASIEKDIKLCYVEGLIGGYLGYSTQSWIVTITGTET